MDAETDVLVIGAGPAGASTAILLAKAGWRVVLVEQHSYPRQKVCGECIGAGALALIDELGIGTAFRRLAGAELRQIGWMSAARTIVADLPPCAQGPYRYGRALGRDRLDALLLERARALGARVLQPAKVRRVRGAVGRFVCDIEQRMQDVQRSTSGSKTMRSVCAAIVVDAHGSWEAGPTFEVEGDGAAARRPRRDSDLFAFKASFRDSTLASGLLPVLALDGGYGGIVLADQGRTTLACCIRRDALKACRALMPDATAGVAVETTIRDSCDGVQEVLDTAHRDGPWLSAGPIRPGIRLDAACGVFRVGNAAGETHPLIGEGISMALQSSAILVNSLTRHSVAKLDARCAADLQRVYAAAWIGAFASRTRLAAAYAHAAMRPACADPLRALLRRWPPLLTEAARLAGKGRRGLVPRTLTEDIV